MNNTKNEFEFKENLFLNIILIIAIIMFAITITTNPKGKKEDVRAENYKITPYANELTDLTGTTWQFNETINAQAGYGSFDVYCSYAENEGIQIEDGVYTTLYIGYRFNFGEYTPTANSAIWMPYIGLPDIFTIGGGFDVKDTNLINWLKANATQLINEVYEIKYNLQNVIITGNIPNEISTNEELTINITAYNNYVLPQSIMVINADYTWDSTNGILTIENATGDVEISVRAEIISGNYTFMELIDSVILIPINTFFSLFNFEIFEVNIYALLTATLTLFVIIKVLLKVFK